MNDEELAIRVADELKAWDSPLPPDVSGRLRAARRTALAEITASEKRRNRSWWIPGIASGAAAFVALLTFGVMNRTLELTSSIDPVDDVVMLSSEDEFEMFNDVEFLLWLGEQQDVELG